LCILEVAVNTDSCGNCRCSTAEALDAATLHPALTLGIQHRKGTLSYGADADFLLLSDDLDVLAVFVGGQLSWSKPKAFTITQSAHPSLTASLAAHGLDQLDADIINRVHSHPAQLAKRGLVGSSLSLPFLPGGDRDRHAGSLVPPLLHPIEATQSATDVTTKYPRSDTNVL